ncbi:MAG TPA: CBS domain-containing protein [Steroidobacteraceae bacterium]|nr:CBS domain-containing protein [Steroidobacteraceae bacterium]
MTVNAGAQVSDAARLMCEEHVGALVVTAALAENPVPIGMLTDRDIVCAQLDRTVDFGQLRVADVMTSDPLVLNEETSVEQAIHQLRSRRVRRAPVIDPAGKLVGVLSLDDLLSHLGRSVQALARTAQLRSHPHQAEWHDRRGRVPRQG